MQQDEPDQLLFASVPQLAAQDGGVVPQGECDEPAMMSSIFSVEEVSPALEDMLARVFPGKDTAFERQVIEFCVATGGGQLGSWNNNKYVSVHANFNFPFLEKSELRDRVPSPRKKDFNKDSVAAGEFSFRQPHYLPPAQYIICPAGTKAGAGAKKKEEAGEEEAKEEAAAAAAEVEKSEEEAAEEEVVVVEEAEEDAEEEEAAEGEAEEEKTEEEKTEEEEEERRQTLLVHLLRFYFERKIGLDRPMVVISVTGSADEFDLVEDRKDMLMSKLMVPGVSEDAWYVTGGTNAGIMKHMGEARVKHAVKVPMFGIAPHGVIRGRTALEERSMNMYDTGSKDEDTLEKADDDKGGAAAPDEHQLHSISVPDAHQPPASGTVRSLP
ncbi:hypothetical protein T484DRAFT_1896207 [Baffinella frigidus]|nr:hypothetical protein T484DRAFT_1896207 [Cryptophyta sp. CCMP2293]